MLCSMVLWSRRFSWVHPSMDWVKINPDGSVIQDRQQAACGGLRRDSSGSFIVGYACNLGTCTTTQTELYGILYGLHVARGKGLPKVHIESDSRTALLSSPSLCFHR